MAIYSNVWSIESTREHHTHNVFMGTSATTRDSGLEKITMVRFAIAVKCLGYDIQSCDSFHLTSHFDGCKTVEHLDGFNFKNTQTSQLSLEPWIQNLLRHADQKRMIYLKLVFILFIYNVHLYIMALSDP